MTFEVEFNYSDFSSPYSVTNDCTETSQSAITIDDLDETPAVSISGTQEVSSDADSRGAIANNIFYGTSLYQSFNAAGNLSMEEVVSNLSINGRKKAEGFCWEKVRLDWFKVLSLV